MYFSQNIVFAFHGCDKSIADEVFNNQVRLKNSTNTHDWLGHGVYFWQDDPARALDWAKNDVKASEPAVVGAVLHLGKCLDLLNFRTASYVKDLHGSMCQNLADKGIVIPRNLKKPGSDFFGGRGLDCAVIQYVHTVVEDSIVDQMGIDRGKSNAKKLIQNHPDYYDSVRGMFPEGRELYENAGFREKNHIQICVRNPNCILGYFKPIDFDSNYKQFS